MKMYYNCLFLKPKNPVLSERSREYVRIRIGFSTVQFQMVHMIYSTEKPLFFGCFDKENSFRLIKKTLNIKCSWNLICFCVTFAGLFCPDTSILSIHMYTVQLNYRIPKELSLEYCTVPRESQTLFLFLRKQSHLGPYTSRIYLHFQLFPRCIGDTVFPRTVASACERVLYVLYEH